jgi:hypothetical protein
MSVLSPSILLFRLLIIASVATGVLGGALDPPPQTGAAASVNLLGFVGFVISLTATAGLFMFKAWARGLALTITFANLLFYPLSGDQPHSSWSLLLLDVSSTLWGAVLAMSYVSSLSSRFKFDYEERSGNLD